MANFAVERALAYIISVNGTVVTSSTVSDTDSDDAHMFRLCAVSQVQLDLFLKNQTPQMNKADNQTNGKGANSNTIFDLFL
jgi:hypothetical protein